MRPFSLPISLTLIFVILSLIFGDSIAQPHGHTQQQFHGHAVRANVATSTSAAASTTNNYSGLVAVSATPCSSSNCAVANPAPITLDCEAANGTAYTVVPDMDKYIIVCNIDFPAQNIYPFVLAGSFEECMSQCENINNQRQDNHCAGFVFAPERVNEADDCYLKSSLNDPGPATIPLVGATVLNTVTTMSFTSVLSSTQTLAAAEAAAPLISYRTPKAASAQLLGASTNNPTAQYVEHPLDFPEKLASNLLIPGIHAELITDYPIAGDTGSWTLATSPLKLALSQLSVIPRMSRDGGKGGVVNGTQLFIFCDTASFANGSMVGFTSSSVAVDLDMNGRAGNALTLVDQIGEWQDNLGRMRGFGPMTTGEEAYNIQLSGNGTRYAVWPESSLIPLNETHSLMYASLVYDEVDMSSQAANFTQLGNTLLVISVDPMYGPGAERVVNRLFDQDEVAWGNLGGVRSWGASGVGGMDGQVYVFGQVDGGVLVARTVPSGIADRTQYSYWDGTSWDSGMLPSDAISYLIDTPMMDLDIVYSPYHATFIMVYLTPNADNTFYFRYLNSSSAILPPYLGGDGDYVETIVRNEWSAEQVLYRAAAPPLSFIYAGGVHAGYFGEHDISNGGTKMLLSWTQHTGQDADSPDTGYAHMTAVVTLD